MSSAVSDSDPWTTSDIHMRRASAAADLGSAKARSTVAYDDAGRIQWALGSLEMKFPKRLASLYPSMPMRARLLLTRTLVDVSLPLALRMMMSSVLNGPL